MYAPVPLIEVADHADALRVGRPHGEVHAGDVDNRPDVRAELLTGAVVRALAEQMQIEIREHLPELIGIDDVAGAVVLVDAEAIVERLGGAVDGDARFE